MDNLIKSGQFRLICCSKFQIRLALMAAVAVTLVSTDQIDNKVDVGATVKEVEAMLAK